MPYRGANKKKGKSFRSNSRKSGHSSRTATLQEEIQEITTLFDEHNWTDDDRVDVLNATSVSWPTSESGSMGLREAIHSHLANHDRIIEGPRYCLLLRANEITYGGMKPLLRHVWTEAKIKDLMRPDFEITHVAILDPSHLVLQTGRTRIALSQQNGLGIA